MNNLQTQTFPTGIQSFGNKSLQENIKDSEIAIAKVQYTEQIWNKSRSQWMLKHLTCSQADGWLRMRQISAEMASKRRALNSAKFSYLKCQAKAEIYREKASKASKTKAHLLNIKAEEKESNAQEILVKVEGALKEVQTLSQMHDSLKEQLGEISEAEFEQAQTVGHIKRALQQATREVRESGRIKTGNQEYLEQCGVSVTYAFKRIDEYLKQEDESGVANTSMLYDFLDKTANELEPVAKQQAELLGFDKDTNLSLTFDPKEDSDA